MSNFERTKQLAKMEGQWYGRQSDIFQELNELDMDVHEFTSEYIITGYYDQEADEGVLIKIALGGTERTITIEAIEEIERY